MKCENYLCIYEDKGRCVLKGIELDITGQCKECIYITLDEKTLKEAKNPLF